MYIVSILDTGDHPDSTISKIREVVNSCLKPDPESTKDLGEKLASHLRQPTKIYLSLWGVERRMYPRVHHSDMTIENNWRRYWQLKVCMRIQWGTEHREAVSVQSLSSLPFAAELGLCSLGAQDSILCKWWHSKQGKILDTIIFGLLPQSNGDFFSFVSFSEWIFCEPVNF